MGIAHEPTNSPAERPPKLSGKPRRTRRLRIEELRHLVELNRAMLLSFPNARTVGVGYVKEKGESTGELGIIVGVVKKVSESELEKRGVLPRILFPGELDIRIDVQEVGKVRALKHADGEKDEPRGFPRRPRMGRSNISQAAADPSKLHPTIYLTIKEGGKKRLLSANPLN